MRTFTVNEPSGAATKVTAEAMELHDGVMLFLTGGNPVAAFAAWTTVIEDGVATPNPAPAPLTEPAAVTELRESLRDRGATVE